MSVFKRPSDQLKIEKFNFYFRRHNGSPPRTNAALFGRGANLITAESNDIQLYSPAIGSRYPFYYYCRDVNMIFLYILFVFLLCYNVYQCLTSQCERDGS